MNTFIPLASHRDLDIPHTRPAGAAQLPRSSREQCTTAPHARVGRREPTENSSDDVFRSRARSPRTTCNAVLARFRRPCGALFANGLGDVRERCAGYDGSHGGERCVQAEKNHSTLPYPYLTSSPTPELFAPGFFLRMVQSSSSSSSSTSGVHRTFTGPGAWVTAEVPWCVYGGGSLLMSPRTRTRTRWAWEWRLITSRSAGRWGWAWTGLRIKL